MNGRRKTCKQKRQHKFCVEGVFTDSTLKYLFVWQKLKPGTCQPALAVWAPRLMKAFDQVWALTWTKLETRLLRQNGAIFSVKSSLLELACVQALLLGRVKGVSGERASKRRSREGQGKGPSLARSREAHFAYPNRRACLQAYAWIVVSFWWLFICSVFSGLKAPYIFFKQLHSIQYNDVNNTYECSALYIFKLVPPNKQSDCSYPGVIYHFYNTYFAFIQTCF